MSLVLSHLMLTWALIVYISVNDTFLFNNQPLIQIKQTEMKDFQKVYLTVAGQLTVSFCFHFQSVVGLASFQHHKVGKKSELTLVWIPEDREQGPVEQVRTTASEGLVCLSCYKL